MNLDYSKPYIQDAALSILLGGTENSRHSWVKRALRKGALLRLKRGVYLIQQKGAPLIDAFEIAQQLYGPSYISFESALSYHGWIPEAVYTTTSASAKRSSDISTPIGMFSYEHTPQFQFFMGVVRIATPDSTFLMAHPWKAIADYMYARHKKWESFTDVLEDLRLEKSAIQSSDRNVLEEISQYYESPRVRRFARRILKEFKWM